MGKNIQEGVVERLTKALAERRRSQNWLAAEIGVAQSTLNRQVKDGSLPLETVVSAARVLDVPLTWLLGEEEEGGRDEVRTWADYAVQLARHAQGYEGADPDEVRRIKADILNGCIRLGRLEGRDVRTLEDELAKLGPLPMPEGGPSAASVLAIYDRDSAAALERAVGLRHFGRAAEIEAEEARARRLAVNADEEAVRIALQGHRAVEIAQQAEREAGGSGTSPAPPKRLKSDETRQSPP